MPCSRRPAACSKLFDERSQINASRFRAAAKKAHTKHTSCLSSKTWVESWRAYHYFSCEAARLCKVNCFKTRFPCGRKEKHGDTPGTHTHVCPFSRHLYSAGVMDRQASRARATTTTERSNTTPNITKTPQDNACVAVHEKMS